jgi:recombination protein RecA
VSDFLTTLKKKYGKNANFLTGTEIPPIERLSTGIAGLDLILGGGIPKGRMIEISGLEHLGKTAISMSICDHLIRTGHDTLYMDMERTVTQDQLISAGIDPNKFLICQPDHGEAALSIAVDAAESGVSLTVIDSLPMLMPKATEEKIDADCSARDVAGIASLLDRVRVMLVKSLEHSGGSLLFTNQVRDKINSPYGGLNTPGGHTIKHLYSVRMQLTYAKVSTETPGTIISTMRVLKNKTYTNSLEASFTIENGRVDRAESLVQAAVSLGLIQKSGGGWHKLGEQSIGQGSQKAGAYLAQNPELYGRLYQEVLEKGIRKVTLDEVEEDDAAE